MEVFDTGTQEVPLVVEVSHLTTEPVCPLKVRFPPFTPEQMFAVPETIPPFDSAVIFTITEPETFLVHVVALASVTLTSEYVKLPATFVGTGTIASFPLLIAE